MIYISWANKIHIEVVQTSSFPTFDTNLNIYILYLLMLHPDSLRSYGLNPLVCFCSPLNGKTF